MTAEQTSGSTRRKKTSQAAHPELDELEFEYLTYEISRTIEATESLRKRVEQVLAFWMTVATVALGGTAAITTSQNTRQTTITVILGVASLVIGGVGLVTFTGAVATRTKEAVESLRVDHLRAYMTSRFPFAQGVSQLLGSYNRAPGKFSFEFLLFATMLLVLNSVAIPLGIELALVRILVVVLPTVNVLGIDQLRSIANWLAVITLVVCLLLQTFHFMRHRRQIAEEKKRLDARLASLIKDSTRQV